MATLTFWNLVALILERKKRKKLRSRCCKAKIQCYLTNSTKQPAMRYCTKCMKDLNPLNQPIKEE